jgi:hypothetical protein
MEFQMVIMRVAMITSAGRNTRYYKKLMRVAIIYKSLRLLPLVETSNAIEDLLADGVIVVYSGPNTV